MDYHPLEHQGQRSPARTTLVGRPRMGEGTGYVVAKVGNVSTAVQVVGGFESLHESSGALRIILLTR